MRNVTHNHRDQHISVSDKCYSMLLRRQSFSGESLNCVINRLVNENKYSTTAIYQKNELNHSIFVDLELKKILYKIKSEHNLRRYDEVIWRIVVNGSKK